MLFVLHEVLWKILLMVDTLPMNICAIDFSKAFDKVNHFALFQS